MAGNLPSSCLIPWADSRSQYLKNDINVTANTARWTDTIWFIMVCCESLAETSLHLEEEISVGPHFEAIP